MERSFILKRPVINFIDTSSAMQYNVLQKGGVIMAFSIRLTEEERKLANSYAKLHSMSLSEAFKSALFEKIEDEYDISIAHEALAEYNTTKQSKPIEELWKELDL